MKSSRAVSKAVKKRPISVARPVGVSEYFFEVIVRNKYGLCESFSSPDSESDGGKEGITEGKWFGFPHLDLRHARTLCQAARTTADRRVR